MYREKTEGNDNRERQNSLAGGVLTGSVASEKERLRKKYRNISFILMGVIVLSIGAFAMMQFGPKLTREEIPSEVEQSSVYAVFDSGEKTDAKTEGGGTPNLPQQIGWSKWVDALPDYVIEGYYQLERRTLYRSRQLETTISTEENMQAWELYDTVSQKGEFGAWSDWSKESVSETENREVESKERYRYRDRETKTSASSSLNGWNHYDTTYEWGSFGGWSSWSSSSVSESESRKVETKVQYRYRSYSTQTSYSTSMSGYTQVDSEWVKNSSGSTTYVKSWPSGFNRGHGLFSEYNNSPKSSFQSNTEKLTIDSDSVCGYIYFHWCRGTYTAGPINRKSKSSKIDDCTAFHAFFSTTSPSSLTPANDGDGSYQYANGSCCRDSYWYFYVPVYKQSYTSYNKLYTYAKWLDWSEWDDKSYNSTSTRQVETRTLYRYCDREEIPTYHFYRWKEWSNWADEVMKESDTREVESATFYRYREREKQELYCYRRWGDWSNYQIDPVEGNDMVEVETVIQYRYKSKDT